MGKPTFRAPTATGRWLAGGLGAGASDSRDGAQTAIPAQAELVQAFQEGGRAHGKPRTAAQAPCARGEGPRWPAGLVLSCCPSCANGVEQSDFCLR